MKKTVCKALLSLLCAVTLLVGVAPTAAVSAEMGCDFPWTKEQTLLEKIIQRDGLLDGVWYPWIDASKSGHNLTGNDVMAKYYGDEWAEVELDAYGADKIYQEIYNLKAMGFNMMAWGGSIYGEGVKFDDYGDVIGIKEEYLTNARRLLDMCREIGMPVMWNIYFHSSSAPHYYGMDGWNIVARMLGDRTVADHYAEKFVKPLCKMLGEYKDVVALVSIADEPENEINDAAIGNHFAGDRAMYGVNQDDMIYFMKGINDAVREVLPDMPRTVASNNMNKAIYRDFDLDLMGHNRYDSNASIPKVDSYFADADMILMEYNVGGDFKASHEQFAERLAKFRENFVKEGYKGGFQWCWIGTATDAGYHMLTSKWDNTSFKSTVTLLKYYMDEYRAAYRGDKLGLVAPVLYANTGNGKVQFIPSEKATTITIERSDDGGKTWKALVSNVKQADYVGKNLVGTYTDTTDRPKSGYCYRITATDGKTTVTSAPNNVPEAAKKYHKDYQFEGVDYPTNIAYEPTSLTQEQAKLLSFGTAQNRPISADKNLIKNGSFESTDGQWNNDQFLKYAAVVTDKTAPDGKKSLCFDTTGKDEGWYTFNVKVEKGVSYTLSTWIKGDYLSKNNAGKASFGVIDPATGKFMVYWEYFRSYARSSRLTQQIYPTAWDNEWHLRSVQFESESDTVTIALYGAGSKMWIDDMALFRIDEGVRYTSTNYESNLSYKYYVECATCPLSKSLTKNVRMDDTDDTYWQSGDGWRNGFLSFADNKNEYGRSLKYTGGADSVGNYYIKWVDVKPNTEYVFSASVKILKGGKARLSLIDDKMEMPVENMALELDSEVFGEEWFHYSIRFDTSGLTGLGIGICDLGGEALFDNIRLFKVSDAKEETDPFIDASGATVTEPTATVKPTTKPVSTKKTTTTTAKSTTTEKGTTTEKSTTTTTEAVSTTATDTTQSTEASTTTVPSEPTEGGDQPADGTTAPNPEAPTPDNPQPKDNRMTIILLCVAGALLIAAGAVITVILLRKKNASAAAEDIAEEETPETDAPAEE